MEKCFREFEVKAEVKYELKIDGETVSAKVKCPFCSEYLAVGTNKKDQSFCAFNYWNFRRHIKLCKKEAPVENPEALVEDPIEEKDLFLEDLEDSYDLEEIMVGVFNCNIVGMDLWDRRVNNVNVIMERM